MKGVLFHKRPVSYSKKESESNDEVLILFEEISNVHNGDRSSSQTCDLWSLLSLHPLIC